MVLTVHSTTVSEFFWAVNSRRSTSIYIHKCDLNTTQSCIVCFFKKRFLTQVSQNLRMDLRNLNVRERLTAMWPSAKQQNGRNSARWRQKPVTAHTKSLGLWNRVLYMHMKSEPAFLASSRSIQQGSGTCFKIWDIVFCYRDYYYFLGIVWRIPKNWIYKQMSMKLSHYLIFKMIIRSCFGWRNLSGCCGFTFWFGIFHRHKIGSQHIRDLKSQEVQYDWK